MADITEIMRAAGIENAVNIASTVIVLVSLSALLTALIVEAGKTVPAIDRHPTKLVCYVVSLVVTPVVFLAFMAYRGIAIRWWTVVAVILGAFVVAKVSMGGWDDLTELAGRMFPGHGGKT